MEWRADTIITLQGLSQSQNYSEAILVVGEEEETVLCIAGYLPVCRLLSTTGQEQPHTSHYDKQKCLQTLPWAFPVLFWEKLYFFYIRLGKKIFDFFSQNGKNSFSLFVSLVCIFNEYIFFCRENKFENFIRESSALKQSLKTIFSCQAIIGS